MGASITARVQDGWDGLLRRAEKRLPALTRHKQPEALPITLHSRRIYVLPTPFGFVFGSVLLVMLVGALNYTNNAALLLTFLIAGAANLSLHRTVATLRGLKLERVHADPVFAGSDLALQLQFAGDERERPAIRLRQGDRETLFSIAPDGATAALPLATRRRGWQSIGRINLSTEHPLGLFRAWSVLHPDAQMLVWPKPEAVAPPLPHRPAHERGPDLKGQGEEWTGLRDYRLGDAPRLIAWKATARQARLMVKEFVAPQAAEIELDEAAAALADPEARIARLARWVLDADASGMPYRLTLGGSTIGPGTGDTHRLACLRALAIAP